MSVVTGIMLVTTDDETVEQVQAWLEADDWGRLVDVSNHAGGSKHPEFSAWCAGFNFFDNDEFVEFVMSLDWRFPEDTVLIVSPQEGPIAVHRPKGTNPP